MKIKTSFLILFFTSLFINAQSISWQKSIGGLDADAPRVFLQTFDGDYLIVGESDSDATGDKNQHSNLLPSPNNTTTDPTPDSNVIAW